MRATRRSVFHSVMLLFAGVLAASAQMGMGMRQPQLQGVWNPVVGAGGVYQVETKSEPKTEMEIAVVGKETVDAKQGYWLEMGMNSPREGGQLYFKQLIVLEGKQTTIRRMIVQPPGQGPMEMSVEMMRGGPTEKAADYRDRAERVGSETVTTPAGTFTCEHWRAKDGSGEIWFSEKVAPYGLVKATGRDATMTLVRVLTDAKTHITGTPQKFDPMEMMRRRRDNP